MIHIRVRRTLYLHSIVFVHENSRKALLLPTRPPPPLPPPVSTYEQTEISRGSRMDGLPMAPVHRSFMVACVRARVCSSRPLDAAVPNGLTVKRFATIGGLACGLCCDSGSSSTNDEISLSLPPAGRPVLHKPTLITHTHEATVVTACVYLFLSKVVRTLARASGPFRQRAVGVCVRMAFSRAPVVAFHT